MSHLVKIPSRCRNPACMRLCLRVGDRLYCNNCAKRARYRGVLDVPCLTVPEKKAYIKAALYFARLKVSRPSLVEIEVFLQSCGIYHRRQADICRQGWRAPQKAMAILAIIHRQRIEARKRRHTPTAAAQLLAACAGTMAMTMPTSNPRYVKMQVARSVVHLVKGEEFTWQGKRHRQRVRLQSRHLAKALYDALRPFWLYWLESHRIQIIHRASTYKPLPSSQKRNHHV